MDIIHKLLDEYITSYITLRNATASLDALMLESLDFKEEYFQDTIRPRPSIMIHRSNKKLMTDCIEHENTQIETIKNQLECFFENRILVDEICELKLKKYNYYNIYKKSLSDRDTLLNADYVIVKNLQMYQSVHEKLSRKLVFSKLKLKLK